MCYSSAVLFLMANDFVFSGLLTMFTFLVVVKMPLRDKDVEVYKIIKKACSYFTAAVL